ncbi:hypothetical protein PCAR4_370061 [Paraburkholderia caribensis]|nr:hypothetical protein PCAR4_370061 [Paraburkholderia caribensis]
MDQGVAAVELPVELTGPQNIEAYYPDRPRLFHLPPAYDLLLVFSLDASLARGVRRVARLRVDRLCPRDAHVARSRAGH